MQATEFVTSYLDASNRQDARAIANHLAENGTYPDIPDQQNMSRKQLLAHLDELFREETNVYELTGEVLVGQSTIASQYMVRPRDSREPTRQLRSGTEPSS